MMKPSIESAIEILMHFQDFPNISNCLLQLRAFEISKDVKVVESIRTPLNNILFQQPECDITVQGGYILGNAIRHSLLALAAAAPINVTDPISGKMIEESRRVVVSSGNQFDLLTFIDWHHTREPSQGELKFKQLRNPFTGEILPDHDFLWIRAVAAACDILFFQQAESDLKGITRISPTQKLHPFTLELDRLSGSPAITFLKKWGGLDDLPAILALSPNAFHCASTPTIHQLFKYEDRPSFSAVLSMDRNTRLLFQHLQTLQFLENSKETLYFILRLDKIQAKQLLNTVQRSPELIQFLLDQKWPIIEVVCLHDAHLDLLELKNVRQFLRDHKVTAEQFKDFRQYYSSCRQDGCHFSYNLFNSEQFLKDIKCIASYRALLEPIKSISELLAGLQGYDVSAKEEMQGFQRQVIRIEWIKTQYSLSEEAAFAFYRHPSVTCLTDDEIQTGHIFENQAQIEAVIASLIIPSLSQAAITELLEVLKTGPHYHTADRLLENWTQLSVYKKIELIHQVPENILCFTEDQRTGLQFLKQNKPVETALLSSLAEDNRPSLRATLSSLSEYTKQQILKHAQLIELLQQAAITPWKVLFDYTPEQINSLYTLTTSPAILDHLATGALTLDIMFQCQHLSLLQYSKAISYWLQKKVLTVKEVCLLSDDQLKLICSSEVIKSYQNKMLTKEDILSLTYSNKPWSLGFAIASGLFSSDLVKTLEAAKQLSEMEQQLYCHPVACQLIKDGRATVTELLQLTSEQKERLGIGRVTFDHLELAKVNPYYYRLSNRDAKILDLIDIDPDLTVGKILAANWHTLSTWCHLTNCQVIYEKLRAGELKLDDSDLQPFTNDHCLSLNDREVLSCIQTLHQSWRCVLKLTPEIVARLREPAYQKALEDTTIQECIRSNQLIIERVLCCEHWHLHQLSQKAPDEIRAFFNGPQSSNEMSAPAFRHRSSP
jgi:hypothetical protein